MVRRVGRVLAAMTLVLSAAACDDNPLAEDRDEAAYFRLNPSNVAVNAGSTVKVNAVIVNKYGAATNASVTATPCDNKISAVVDTGRTEFEFPERFNITGVTLGRSCLVVRGGGITDTVDVRVVPASIDVVGLDTLGSGTTTAATLRFLDANGNPVTGFTMADVTFTSLATGVAVVDSAGNVQARAPGAGQIVTALRAGAWGATRVDTARFTVKAGPFTGTIAQAPLMGGQGLTFTQGALAFDADTEVRLTLTGSPFGAPTSVARANGTTATAMLPLGLPAGTSVRYDIVNLGVNQVAVTGSFATTAASPAVDTWGTTVTNPATAPTMTVGTDVFGTMGATDTEAYIKFVAARTGSHTLTVDWSNASDIDVAILSATGAVILSRGTVANPETGSATLTAGTTYYVYLYQYEAAAPTTPYRIRLQ